MKFRNSGREKFLAVFEEKASLDLPADTLSSRCKFNFCYFDVQKDSQSFEDWSPELLVSLLNKLKEFSKEPLKYWVHQEALNIYGTFPSKSKLTEPKHVPHQVKWAAFRLDKSTRLVGFVIPDEYEGTCHKTTKPPFDCNVFYVVFFDKNHKFYPMDIKNNKN